MKTILILVALAVVACKCEETYSTKYDDFDVESLTSNTRLLRNYAKCFLKKGPCTPEGTDFKEVIPDALKTRCRKCSPKQKDLIRAVVKAMQAKIPDLWQELVKKEDPKGQYKGEFEAFVNGN